MQFSEATIADTCPYTFRSSIRNEAFHVCFQMVSRVLKDQTRLTRLVCGPWSVTAQGWIFAVLLPSTVPAFSGRLLDRASRRNFATPGPVTFALFNTEF